MLTEADALPNLLDNRRREQQRQELTSTQYSNAVLAKLAGTS